MHCGSTKYNSVSHLLDRLLKGIVGVQSPIRGDFFWAKKFWHLNFIWPMVFYAFDKPCISLGENANQLLINSFFATDSNSPHWPSTRRHMQCLCTAGLFKRQCPIRNTEGGVRLRDEFAKLSGLTQFESVPHSSSNTLPKRRLV